MRQAYDTHTLPQAGRTLLRRLLSSSAALICLLLLGAGCKGGSDTPEQPSTPFELSTEELTLRPGDTAELAITGGSGLLDTFIGQVGIATATIQGSTITVRAIREGEETLSIQDRHTKHTKEVKIHISAEAQLTATPGAAQLFIGDKRVLHITGGSGDYTVASANEAVATGTLLERGQVLISAAAAGATTLTVTDASTTATCTIPIEVLMRPLQIEATTSSMQLFDMVVLPIKQGNGTYTITVEDPSVIDVTAEGLAITITAKAIGHTSFTITDTVTDQQHTVEVEVEPRTLQLSQTLITSSLLGGSISIEIEDGCGEYSTEVTSGADIVSADHEGSIITITPLQAGSATVRVSDLISGQTIDISTTILTQIMEISLSADRLDLSTGETGTIQVLNPTWDTPYYSLTYDSSMISASKNSAGNTYTITAKKSGQTVLRVVDWYNKVKAEIPITITD